MMRDLKITLTMAALCLLAAVAWFGWRTNRPPAWSDTTISSCGGILRGKYGLMVAVRDCPGDPDVDDAARP
ncbi:hypothetical protein DFP88_101824 [Pseudoroseicyclus aestuarii]|uniref:Uncharacterized protein n=1 Tax=Pseudoroseicyclus aestuarii TaxID=1795041 RepID=A0A318T2D2_9RHOB|nr:hypothetical protein DFP88_101824 [Pseudoroseicyclus aestuarii]